MEEGGQGKLRGCKKGQREWREQRKTCSKMNITKKMKVFLDFKIKNGLKKNKKGLACLGS